MKGIIIRAAEAGDVPALLELFGELDRMQRDWRVFRPRESFRRDIEATFRRSLSDPSSMLAVAADGDRVVGMATGHVIRPSSFSDEIAVEVGSVIVRAVYRGRGIATALVREVARFAREHGVTWVALKTFALNEEALAYWERLGFRARIVQMTAAVQDLDHGPDSGPKDPRPYA